MNLRQELDDILDRMREAQAVFIMDSDGLVVEKADRGEIPDVETAIVEFMQGFHSVNSSAAELGTGEVERLSIETSGTRYLFHRINQGYVLVLALSRDGFLGEGRFRLGRASERMAPDFAV